MNEQEPQAVVVTGAMPNDFANVIAAAIDKAQEDGLDLDVAVCVAVGVCADYARAEYSDKYLDALAYIVKSRAGKPLPRSGDVVGSPRGQND